MKTCGQCKAGVVVKHNGTVAACRTCRLFETDADAAQCVIELLEPLAAAYEAREDATVADALDDVIDAVETGMPGVRALKSSPALA